MNKRQARTLKAILGMGAIAGVRAMLAPALLSRAWNRPLHGRGLRPLGSPRAAQILTALAAGEMLVDKWPRLPARTEAVALASRALSGGFVGWALGRRRRFWRRRTLPQAAAAALGAAAGVAGAFGAVQLRRLATRAGLPNTAAGLFEDGLMLLAGQALLR